MALVVLLQLLIVTSLAYPDVQPPHKPLCEEPCEITGSQLQSLINKALSDPDVDYTKQALEGNGYYFLAGSASGWRQSKIPGTQPGATMIVLPFGMDTDPTLAAFIVWGFSEGDTGYSAVEMYWGVECPLPDFEEVEEQTWIRGVSSSGEGYSPPVAGKSFWKCWLAGTGGGCGGCLLGCLLADGGYWHCLAICCGPAVVVSGIGCFLYHVLK